jgi:hypothetical protein
MPDDRRVFILPEGSGIGCEAGGVGTINYPFFSTPERGRESTLVLRDGCVGSNFIPLDRLTFADPEAYRRAWGSAPDTLADNREWLPTRAEIKAWLSRPKTQSSEREA